MGEDPRRGRKGDLWGITAWAGQDPSPRPELCCLGVLESTSIQRSLPGFRGGVEHKTAETLPGRMGGSGRPGDKHQLRHRSTNCLWVLRWPKAKEWATSITESVRGASVDLNVQGTPECSVGPVKGREQLGLSEEQEGGAKMALCGDKMGWGHRALWVFALALGVTEPFRHHMTWYASERKCLLDCPVDGGRWEDRSWGPVRKPSQLILRESGDRQLQGDKAWGRTVRRTEGHTSASRALKCVMCEVTVVASVARCRGLLQWAEGLAGSPRVGSESRTVLCQVPEVLGEGCELYWATKDGPASLGKNPRNWALLRAWTHPGCYLS